MAVAPRGNKVNPVDLNPEIFKYKLFAVRFSSPLLIAGLQDIYVKED